MKLRWSSIDGTSWRAMTDNGFIGNVVLLDEDNQYLVAITNSEMDSDLSEPEVYATASRQSAETLLLERAGLL